MFKLQQVMSQVKFQDKKYAVDIVFNEKQDKAMLLTKNIGHIYVFSFTNMKCVKIIENSISMMEDFQQVKFL